MTAVRQIEAADLMIGQNNFTVMFARALRAATSENQLATTKKGKGAGKPTPSGQQIARMERELATLQTQVKSVEETYGIDNLHLTVARGSSLKSSRTGESTMASIPAAFARSTRLSRAPSPAGSLSRTM